MGVSPELYLDSGADVLKISQTELECRVSAGMVPAVSILLPFRNAASTLPECLDSIQKQTLNNFEALLINDGSEDRSAELIKERALNDPRISLIEPGCIGLVAALNLGIAKARSELIARMDADDIMHPDRLRLQEEFLHLNPDISLVGCKVELFPDHIIRTGYREYVRWQNRCIEPGDIVANLYVESPLAHPSVMIRRISLEHVGGYVEGPFPEDYDLWFRFREAGFRMAKLPQTLLSWRERHDRTSRVDQRYSREAFDRLRAEYLARDPRVHSARELVVWGGGRPTRHRVKHLLKKGIRVKAWVDINPRRIGRIIWGLPVRPPDWLDRRPRPFVLIYVTNHGARDEIAEKLDAWGYRPGEDYLAVG
jgi:glycosyltransferase involved in cell wall biosynthesis